MNHGFLRRAVRGGAATLLILALSACGGATSPAPATETPAAVPRDIVVLDKAALDQAGITIEESREIVRADAVSAPGLMAIDETRTARIGSLQEGLLLQTLAQVGDRVRTKQLLATMHGHAVHDAWAGYQKAIADRRRLEKELAFAQEAHERAKRLYADKAIALQDLQRAEVNEVSAQGTLEIGVAEVTRAIEELEHIGVVVESGVNDDKAESTSEDIPVTSPISGIVLERLVTPGTTVIPGTPLFVVSELTTLWALAEVDESVLPHVRVGRAVEITVAAYPGETFPGTISFIGDIVNPKTRRITVRSTVPNTSGRLKPEMFAMIKLGEGDARPMTVVPEAAIQTLGGKTSVFVAEGNGRFRPRQVELASQHDGLVEVTSGLKAGEQVVAGGSFVLKSELLRASAGSEN